jgi:hypothetical protein
MNDLDTLSIELSQLLKEAKALMNLKSEFGRMPECALRSDVLDLVDAWFKAGYSKRKPKDTYLDLARSGPPNGYPPVEENPYWGGKPPR